MVGRINEVELDVTSKKLNFFVDRLSDLNEVEDVFKFINDQLVKLKNINNIVLCISPIKNRKVIYFKNKLRVHVRQVDHLWLQDSTIRFDNQQDSQFLANHLKRPVGQIIAFPIKMKQLESICKMEVPATIFVEHSSPKTEQDQLIKKLINYIQPIQFSLEQSFLQLYLDNAAIEWQNTFDGLKDPICIVDNEYNILRANKSFSASTVTNQKCHEVLFKSIEVCPNCPKEQMIDNDLSQTSILQKGKKLIEVHSYPIRQTGSDAVSHIVNHYIDITEKQDLKGKMLQGEKLSVIGQLAENISHELNNPLTGIKSLAEVLMSEKNMSEDMLSDLSEISSAAERCQNIINSLMMFSSDSSQSQKRLVSMNDQVKVAMTLSKSIQGSKQLHYNLSEQTTEVLVVPELMVQVIFNLIQNACQATDPDGIIELNTQEKDGYVFLSVKDNGEGIDSKVLQDIFKPFYTTKTIGEGTGLGLSMSLGIIKSFGGDIIVNSKKGVGAEFEVKLPKAKVNN